jgi:DNA processing protein
MKSRHDLRYWLALSRIPMLSPTTVLELTRVIPDLSGLFEQPDDFYEALALPDAAQGFLKQPDWFGVEADLAWLESSSEHHIITALCPTYPASLLETATPPPLIFVQGDISLLQQSQIAMVGSRKASFSGKDIAYRLSRELSQNGLVISSGLALGIDTAAHQGALSAGSTIAVVGSGLDIIYPKSNWDLAKQIRQQGAIISEFTIGTPPLPNHFPRRNRIISGLSLGTVVIEASLKSGSLITARLANEQGRDVFAIPGSINNPLARGCHVLIKQGAKLVENVHDILEELHFLPTIKTSPKPTQRPLSQNTLEEDHLKLLECVDYEPAKIDILVIRSQFCIQKITSLLIDLEIAGYVCSTVGGYMRVCDERRNV